jgi:hypothetical protein
MDEYLRAIIIAQQQYINDLEKKNRKTDIYKKLIPRSPHYVKFVINLGNNLQKLLYNIGKNKLYKDVHIILKSNSTEIFHIDFLSENLQCLDKYNIIEQYDITICGQKIQPICNSFEILFTFAFNLKDDTYSIDYINKTLDIYYLLLDEKRISLCEPEVIEILKHYKIMRDYWAKRWSKLLE